MTTLKDRLKNYPPAVAVQAAYCLTEADAHALLDELDRKIAEATPADPFEGV